MSRGLRRFMWHFSYTVDILQNHFAAFRPQCDQIVFFRVPFDGSNPSVEFARVHRENPKILQPGSDAVVGRPTQTFFGFGSDQELAQDSHYVGLVQLALLEVRFVHDRLQLFSQFLLEHTNKQTNAVLNPNANSQIFEVSNIALVWADFCSFQIATSWRLLFCVQEYSPSSPTSTSAPLHKPRDLLGLSLYQKHHQLFF